MTLDVLGLDAATYQTSALHGQDRIWVETNCYVDLWIELLHALGLPPQAGAAFCLSIDFDDDQFSFFKYPLEDLRALWNISVAEMNPWRPLDEHLEIQLAKGRLLTVEVDAWFLPDTAGVSFQQEHTKTTVAIQMLDRSAKRLGYFHNRGYYEIDGDNYLGALGLSDPGGFVPYTELIKLDRMRRPEMSELKDLVVHLVRAHLERRPSENIIAKYRRQFDDDLAWLAQENGRQFHAYAFATVRQLGAAAELAASLLAWLSGCGEAGLQEATDHLMTVASTAKSMQFKVARAAAGKAVCFDDLFDRLDTSWAHGLGILEAHYG